MEFRFWIPLAGSGLLFAGCADAPPTRPPAPAPPAAVVPPPPAGPSGLPASAPARAESAFHHARARANAKANAERYAWARKRVDDAVAAAAPWIERSDEELWDLVFSPELWRAMAVNVDRGCPKCGKGIFQGRAPHAWAWTRWVPGHPWKIQCPNCRELFPKNDFGAFYRSGLSPEDGLFHFARADRRLLFNADHPDPADPLHGWCVDDGRGWARVPGAGPADRDWFIAHHAGFGLWTRIAEGLRVLPEAYALTGDPRYAHKGAILLDRLADVFPGYDGHAQLVDPNSGGFWDGIVGPNYWDGVMWEQRAIDYDRLREGIGARPETLAFLRERSRRFRGPRPKESVEDIRRNIEERILIETARHPARIDMNGAATEAATATVDLVLRGPDALAGVVRARLPRIVPPRHLNDDGSGNERSTGYDAGNFGSYAAFLERLAGLDRAAARAALEAQPRLRAGFDFWADAWCLEKYIPQLGDSGSPGASAKPPGPPGAWLALFDLTGDAKYAQVALRLAGGDPTALPRNVFAEDPEGIVARAVAADRAAGEWSPSSVVKRDYKLGILRAGRGPTGTALWLSYSPAGGTSSHAHFDALTFGLYACGLELVCEQGYPLFTGGWPARWGWTSHTRSHATVTVDGQCQRHVDGGRLLAFAGGNGVQMIAAEAPGAPYAQAAAYRRTLLLVEASPERTFVVDVFRVRGGREHMYTVPVLFGAAQPAGLDLAPHPDLCDGYVTKVRAAKAAGSWRVDTAVRPAWGAPAAAHLRVHGSAQDATVLLGEGETRQGHDAAERLSYVFVRRAGDAPLESAFVSVFEPYADRPFLAERPLEATVSGEAADVRVTLADGGAYDFKIFDGGRDAVRAEVRPPGAGAAFELAGVDGSR